MLIKSLRKYLKLLSQQDACHSFLEFSATAFNLYIQATYIIDLTLESMLLCALTGFLRCSKFIPTSFVYNLPRHLCLPDITIYTPESLVFTPQRRTTDPLGVSFPSSAFSIFTLGNSRSITMASP